MREGEMLVSLELYIRSDRRFGFGRTGFWKTFEAARRGFRERDDRELPELTLEQMEEHEEAIRSRFPQELERYVNFFLPNVAVRTPDTVIAPIRIKCVAIQYGSIKPILDVVGVESADIRNFVLMALSVYAPTAFNEALHSQVDVEASEPNVLGEQRPVATSTSESINPTHQSIASRASDVATRAWTITNLTLVVPV
jgi:predicted trehalose synthase